MRLRETGKKSDWECGWLETYTGRTLGLNVRHILLLGKESKKR